MHGTEFEFRYRFYIHVGVYLLAFTLLYRLDTENVSFALLRALHAPHLDWPLESDWPFRVMIFGGAAIAFAGALLRTWGSAYLESAVVHDTRVHAEALVADGPYRRVRNPLYLGSLMISFGMGLLASRLGFVVLMVTLTFLALRLIGREEAQLAQTQGESYRKYCAAVPRLWPSLTAKLPASGKRPQWMQALTGEAFSYLFVIAELCFAITLRSRLTWIIVGASLALYVTLMPLWRKKRAEQAQQ
jgi:protein-S-isoprenylcysteine O-methyltransferase Ste14